MKTKLPELPKTNDDYWDGAETSLNTPKKLNICDTHFKKWYRHDGYIDTHDGKFTCKFCGWGGHLPGYMRIYKEKVVDLRKL